MTYESVKNQVYSGPANRDLRGDPVDGKIYDFFESFREIRDLFRNHAGILKNTGAGSADIKREVNEVIQAGAGAEQTVIVDTRDISHMPKPKQVDMELMEYRRICAENDFVTIDSPNLSRIAPYSAYISTGMETDRAISLCRYMIDEDLRALSGMPDLTKGDKESRNQAFKTMMKRILISFTYLRGAFGEDQLTEFLMQKYKELNKGAEKLVKTIRRQTRLTYDSSPGSTFYGRKAVKKVLTLSPEAYPVYEDGAETLNHLGEWYKTDLKALNRMEEATFSGLQNKIKSVYMLSKRLINTYKDLKDGNCKNFILSGYNEIMELKEHLLKDYDNKVKEHEALSRDVIPYIPPNPKKLKKPGRFKAWIKKAVFGAMGILGLINSADNTNGSTNTQAMALENLQAKEEKVYLQPLESETEEVDVIETGNNLKLVYEDDTVSIEENAEFELSTDQIGKPEIIKPGQGVLNFVYKFKKRQDWKDLVATNPELEKLSDMELSVAFAKFNKDAAHHLGVDDRNEFIDFSTNLMLRKGRNFYSPEAGEAAVITHYLDKANYDEVIGNYENLRTWQKINSTWENMLNEV